MQNKDAKLITIRVGSNELQALRELRKIAQSAGQRFNASEMFRDALQDRASEHGIDYTPSVASR